MTSPPREVLGTPVLRYAGEPSADWNAVPADFVFDGAVIAAALCDDKDETGGCFVYYLYENGAVADYWYESVEDAVEFALTEESAHLTWLEEVS